MSNDAELSRFLREDFLPLRADGGLWKDKDPCDVAVHYLKALTDQVMDLESNVEELQEELAGYGG